MVIKRNRREARQYAFQMLYANEFHADQSDCLLYTSPSPRD